jgi:hypothetical protein
MALLNMNKVIIKVLFFTTVMAACQQTKDSMSENVKDTTAVKHSKKVVISDKDKNSDNPRDWAEFETVFTFADKEVRQKLGVITLTNDSIQFRLSTEDDLCDTQYWGKARNFHPNGDPEIDEDGNQEAYAASEFILEDSYNIIKIRIAHTKDKARIIFADKTGTDTDCFPTPGLLLKRSESVH